VTSAEVLAFDPVQQALCPLALQMRRVAGSVVGRPQEMSAIETELGSAAGRLTAITLEGEPGIGKTRLLLSAVALAEARGFAPIAVAADEELHGPFLVMRSVLASAAGDEEAWSPQARAAATRALDAMSGRDDPGVATLPPDQKLLRQFDLTALAIRDLAEERPVGLFVDDLQWVDDDSMRALRYVVRANPGSRVFLLLSLRPEETAFASEATTFIADMERMGLVRRMKLARFTQGETTEFLRQLLGGDVAPAGAAAVHAQAEGVPFIIEELVQAYRDAGMIQQIDGVWSLARNADRLVPSAVHTLIQRRAGRLPEESKEVLAEAAVLGRSFSVRDLRSVRAHLGEEAFDADRLAEDLEPAVSSGLLTRYPEDAPADYRFTHEQVRSFALAAVSAPRRRGIHAAVVRMLLEGGEPPPESLSLLVRHAAAAGDTERTARYSIELARSALESHAPEEVLRAVELALPAASGPSDRVTLLSLRDEALAMLRRPGDRLEGLAELSALVDALGEPGLDLDVMLRRAAALRMGEEEDRAAELARRVRDLAAERGDRARELAACLGLGQALMGANLGEAFIPSAAEVDLDAAAEAFARAAELAEELGDRPSQAAAVRELGVVENGRVRSWFVDLVAGGESMAYLARVSGGESLSDIVDGAPIAPNVAAAQAHLERALELFEGVGDRRGVMSSVIAMAYLRYGPDIHAGVNPAQRIEEIRRLSSRLLSMSRESERVQTEAQMLFGTHVFARAKMIPDLALSRGEDAYRIAKESGDRSLEFMAAGGVAMVHLSLGDTDEAGRWLDRAAAAAAASPTPLRARNLEHWRALHAAAAGDVAEMRDHFERALELATAQGRPSARCELLARLALEAARLGAERSDEELLTLAERSAAEAKAIAATLPAHPPWGAQADAALAEVALARGDTDAARAAAMSAVAFLRSAGREDLFPELLLPLARAVLAAGSDQERQTVVFFLRVLVSLVAQRTMDDAIRVRWFKGPMGSEFVRLVGPIDAPAGAGDASLALDDDERRLLGLLTEGLTNREIAERLDLDESDVAGRLERMFAKVGASSRGEATALAIREGVL
jgi:DNA-binding CsgD family transcriptional regulator/tetratricopeptide (TPR) repeat protein